MLVLSRRESEKILFPSLGITVEVSRIQGKTVRLGIDAPDEIRVIRSELKSTAELKTPTQKSGSYSTCRHSSSHSLNATEANRAEVQKCLDAANLAVHLAQNQLQQNLTGNAEEALDQALVCLRSLESVVAGGVILETSTVREAATGYKVRSQKTALIVGNPTEPDDQNVKISERLIGFGYKPVFVTSAESLIEFLKHNEQPNLVFTAQVTCLTLENREDSAPSNGLRIFGVGSLNRSKRTFSTNDSKFNCWFATNEDEFILAEQFAF